LLSKLFERNEEGEVEKVQLQFRAAIDNDVFAPGGLKCFSIVNYFYELENGFST
jgi:hypothetical protein